MSKILEAKKKLQFADYLLSNDSPEYAAGAAKHLLLAANLIVSEHLNLDEHSKISPQLVGNQLAVGSEEEQEFAQYFLAIWQMTTRKPAKQEVVNAYKRVNSFLEWVKAKREAQI